MKYRHIHRLGIDLRREHRLTHSWRKTAIALGVLTRSGKPDPAMCSRIARKGYEPHLKETRDRLGLKPYCFTCRQHIRSAPMKYGNRKVMIDNIQFDSRAEGRRYGELKLLEQAGEITELEVHPKYKIVVNGKWVCSYSGDFLYRDASGNKILEDIKGMKTAVYQLKKHLMLAVYGITIVEVQA